MDSDVPKTLRASHVYHMDGGKLPAPPSNKMPQLREELRSFGNAPQLAGRIIQEVHRIVYTRRLPGDLVSYHI